MSWYNERKRHSLARRGLTSPNPEVVRVNANKRQLKPLRDANHLPNALQSRIVDVSRLLRRISRCSPKSAGVLASDGLAQYTLLRKAMTEYMAMNSLPGYLGRAWYGRENWNGNGVVYKRLYELSQAKSPDRAKSLQRSLALSLEVK